MKKIKFDAIEKSIRDNKDLFRKSNYLWNKGNYNSAENVGKVMRSIKDANPRSLEEWVNYYFTVVRSYSHLWNIAEKFGEELRKNGIEVSDDIAMDFVLYRVIYQTYYGYNRENDAIRWLYRYYYPEAAGYIIEKSSDSDDRDSGIDLVVSHANDDGTCELVSFIQVKPESAIIKKDSKFQKWMEKAVYVFFKQFDNMIERYKNLISDDSCFEFRVVYGTNNYFKISEDFMDGYVLPKYVRNIKYKEEI